MDGVTILNTIVSNGNGDIGTHIIASSILIFLLSMLITALIYSICDKINKGVILSIAFSILSLISMGVGILLVFNSTKTTTYEVAISEEVSLTEFTSKYEIIEQRGKIYIVKERENND